MAEGKTEDISKTFGKNPRSGIMLEGKTFSRFEASRAGPRMLDSGCRLVSPGIAYQLEIVGCE